jgi:hypothetical protein
MCDPDQNNTRISRLQIGIILASEIRMMLVCVAFAGKNDLSGRRPERRRIAQTEIRMMLVCVAFADKNDLSGRRPEVPPRPRLARNSS